MADQDWMRHDHAPPPPTVREYPESILWTLTKDSRTVEARIRELPHGRELRVYIDGAFLWSELFVPARAAELYAIADQKLADFQARGWTDGPR